MNDSCIPGAQVRPSIIAHRGASAYAPENTLAAFEKAIEMGADWIELDCRLTRDGCLAVFHDNDTFRFNYGHVPVSELSMKDLRQVDVGSWFAPEFSNERVARLEEVLELASGRVGVYIEIKSAVDETPRIPDMLEVIADANALSSWQWRLLLEAANRISADSVVMAQQVIETMRVWQDRCPMVAQAFSPIMAAVFRRHAPELRFEFLGMDLEEPPNIWRDYIAYGAHIGVHGFNANKESLTEERVRRFHEMGRSCAVWVVDEPEHIRQFAGYAVDAIISNKPDLCRSTLERAH